MEGNQYKIKTWADILNVVTAENIEGLMVDMYKMLDQWVKVKESLTEKELSEIESQGFTWIDDGKHDIIYDIKTIQDLEVQYETVKDEKKGTV